MSSLFETDARTVATFTFFTVYEQPQSGTRKTRDYDVVSKHGERLGAIEFYPAWRQHVLVPAEGSVWSRGCLEDIVRAMDLIRKYPGTGGGR